VYEVVVIGDCLVTTLATVGANVRSVVVSNTHCRITVSTPETREQGTLIARLKEEYPDADVALQRDGTATPSFSRAGLLENAVTDRQRDLLGTAYYSGFFDRQRKRTGTEIADSLGISQPAFSTQLRAAQRNLLASLFEDRSRDTVDRGR
jgi:predicted DNA binding protein